MKILLAHNYYIHKGGEDLVFEAERDLLQAHGHHVETFTVSNIGIDNPIAKIKAGLGTLYNPVLAEQAYQLISSFRPEIIHIHNFFPLISPSFFYAAVKARCPVVMTLHNYRLVCSGGVLVRNNAVCERCLDKMFPLEGIVHGCFQSSPLFTVPITLMSGVHKVLGTWKNKVSHYITLSHFQKEKILQSSLGLEEKQISIKPNFALDHGESIADKQNFVIYVGRFSYEKGVETVLKACEQADIALKVIGAGPLEYIVQDYVSRCPNIEYLGFKSKPDVIALMKQAKALVFPSICYENFPLAIAEAFSTGTPVITSDIGAQAEIVVNGMNGLHYQAGYHEDLRDKLNILLSNDAQHRKFAYNARETYLSNYTAEQNYQQLMDIYHHVISSSSACYSPNS